MARKSPKDRVLPSGTTTRTLEEAFNGNLDLVLFFVTWLKNGLNAGRAYKELHPDVDDHSANTLGSRMLKKVDRAYILEAYGLGPERYFQQLHEGLQAERSDMTGQIFPDHKTRAIYHAKLGRILGFESDGETSLEFKNGEKIIKFTVNRG